jgi:tetratricopeptide (TPR) repeat protein
VILLIILSSYSFSSINNETEQFELDNNHKIQINLTDKELAIDYFKKGNQYGKLKKHQLAIEQYDKAIELIPNFYKAYNNRGNQLNNLGFHAKAVIDLSKAIELKGDYAIAYHNRGRSYRDLGEYELAISDLSRAISLNPDSVKSYASRGLCYEKLHKFNLAISNYERAIALNTNNSTVYNNLAFLLITTNEGKEVDISKVFELAKKALEIAPHNSSNLDTMAAIYAYDNQFDKAIEFQLKAIQHVKNKDKYKLETFKRVLERYKAKEIYYVSY